MTHMVRQLDPTKGIPLEIYCFTYEERREKYEVIKSDHFRSFTNNYVCFNWRFFEEPTGRDFRNLVDTQIRKLILLRY
jgi:miniconductance mechanosensitive channel